MHVIRTLAHCPDAVRNSVIAIGNFDGVHAGHQHVLATARQKAIELQAPFAVLTFEPHPLSIVRPGVSVERLTPMAEKLALLKSLGVETVFVPRFTRAFSQLTAQDFIEQIMVGQLHVRHVVTGENFTFGYQRSGNAASLTELAEQYQFGYSPAKAYDYEGTPCSSSRIRHAIHAGKMEEAAALLTRPFTLFGRVQHGQKKGRELGFPTANLPLTKGKLVPPFGVYAAQVQLEKKAYPAVVNIGVRPTVAAVSYPVVEAHILDANLELYDKKIAVTLRHFIRPEQRFSSLEALQAHIKDDIVRARQWLR